VSGQRYFYLRVVAPRRPPVVQLALVLTVSVIAGGRGQPSTRNELWHGGAPGRRPGDQLLPPAVTGLQRTSSQLSMAEGLDDIAYRSDRIYLSTDRELARIWAGQWTDLDGRVGYGWLYRVEVDVDALEPDEDLLSLPGLSYQAPRATVSSRLRARHRPQPAGVRAQPAASPARLGAGPPAGRLIVSGSPPTVSPTLLIGR